MSCILKYQGSDPLTGDNVIGILARLKRALSSRIKQAYIFGSIARGDFYANSDLDLILIWETKIPFTERGKSFLDLFDIFPRIDLLIYTPDEFKEIVKEPLEGFWKSVVKDLKEL